MTSRVDELLAELEAAMDGVSTPFTSADKADRVYEGYVFSQVIATAAEAGAEVIYEDRDECVVKDLVFRGAPGALHATGRKFTHAVLRFGQARPAEVHLRVKVRSSKGLESECDVLIIDTIAARDSRNKREVPTSTRCVLSIECKYYTTKLPRDEPLAYLGLRNKFRSMPSLFVANDFSAEAIQCLCDERWPYELGVTPKTRFQGYLRAHIREALKRFVTQFDYNCHI